MTVPAVSVVMAFLNGERFLEEAVDSVLSQSRRDLELIMVDDGSTDLSRSIADRHAAADSRVRVVAHHGNVNRGLSASRNAGGSTSDPRATIDQIRRCEEAGATRRLSRRRRPLAAH